MEITEQLEALSYDLRKKSPRTQQRYLEVAHKYLDFSGGEISRPLLLRFMEAMESEWGGNSRRQAHYALARLCKALEVRFPLNGDDLAAAPSRDELRAPSITPREIRLMVNCFKGTGSYEEALLYLSTIYGPRSIELTNVDIMGDRIRLWLAKKRGGKRHPKIHLLLGECHLRGYEKRSEGSVIYAFHGVSDEVGLKKEYGSWHRVRRSLATELQLAGIHPEIITRYLGWERQKLPGQIGASPMLGVYFHLSDDDIDREIFKRHPFLPLWDR